MCVIMMLTMFTACGGGETGIFIDTSTSAPSSDSGGSDVNDSESSVNDSGSSQSTTVNSATGSDDSQSTQVNSAESSDVSQSTSSEEDPNSSIPEISSKRALALYCVDDKKILYSENPDDPIALASITKILTACVALRYMDPETVIEVGSEQDLVKPGSSVCFIAKGHRLKLKDLLTGMLMASGNDAAYTVAVSTARACGPQTGLSDEQAVAEFGNMMNSLAKELGMNNSHFVNPDGWDDERQYTTARDLLLLAEYALTVPEICEIAATHQKRVVFESGEVAVWTNSNRLLDPESEFYNENTIGLKTGTTRKAGCCLLAAFKKNGKTYVSVAAGCGSDEERYEVTQVLIAMC